MQNIQQKRNPQYLQNFFIFPDSKNVFDSSHSFVYDSKYRLTLYSRLFLLLKV